MQTSFPDLMKQVHETIESALRDKHRNSSRGAWSPASSPRGRSEPNTRLHSDKELMSLGHQSGVRQLAMFKRKRWTPGRKHRAV